MVNYQGYFNHYYNCKDTKKSRNMQVFWLQIQGEKLKKSLPNKETFRKAIDGEGHGAVAGNASAKNLNRNGSERLNRFALTQSYSAAKLQQNTETTKKKVQTLINNGYIIKSMASEVDIVRNLSKAILRMVLSHGRNSPTTSNRVLRKTLSSLSLTVWQAFSTEKDSLTIWVQLRKKSTTFFEIDNMTDIESKKVTQ